MLPMISQFDYNNGPMMLHWNPYYNRYQLARPKHRIIRPEVPFDKDYANTYLTPEFKFIYRAGYDVLYCSAWLLTYPLSLMSKMCQVQTGAKSYHIIPHSALILLYRIGKTEGISTLWNGFFVTGIVFIATCFAEKFVSSFMWNMWPRKVDFFKDNFKTILRHLALIAATSYIMAPMNIAALPKYVEVGSISSSSLLQLFHQAYVSCSLSEKSKWYKLLLICIVAYELCHHLLNELLKQLLTECCVYPRHRAVENHHLHFRNVNRILIKEDRRFVTDFYGRLIADTIMYPIGTTLLRFMIQGAGPKNLIDMDTGQNVVRILTTYEHVLNCWSTIVEEEGAAILYRGFGFMVLRHVALAILVYVGRTWWISKCIKSQTKYRDNRKCGKKSKGNGFNVYTINAKVFGSFF